METSILMARLMGPVLLVAAVTMVANPKDLLGIAREFLGNRALIFVTGVLAMVAGLSIVNIHNVWTADWRIIITLFGWALTIGGAARMALPQIVIRVGGAMTESPAMIRIAGAVWLLIGAILAYEGYFMAP
ncbi:MAG: hypothetical protein ACE5FS_12425 [Paracoccaceae bacterium]